MINGSPSIPFIIGKYHPSIWQGQNIKVFPCLARPELHWSWQEPWNSLYVPDLLSFSCSYKGCNAVPPLDFHEILDCMNSVAQVGSWSNIILSCCKKIQSFHHATLIFLLRSWKKASQSLNLSCTKFAAVKTANYFPEGVCVWCKTMCKAPGNAWAWISGDTEAGPILTCCAALTMLLHLFVLLRPLHHFIWPSCFPFQQFVWGTSART